MSDKRIIELPLTDDDVKDLKCGDMVYLTGVIYTGRDAAHKRMTEMIAENKELPLDVKDQIIYYAGPCPNKPGYVIGPVGPTTSTRMDKYSPTMIENGLRFMIGKGLRSQEVKDAIIKNNGIYFAAIGGAAALLSKCVKKAEVIAFEDLGTEAIRRLEVKEFPVIVAIDSKGNDIYKR